MSELLLQENILIKYIRKGIVVDTEPLLLFLVGNYDERYIERFSHTKQYNKSDFEILYNFLIKFQKIIITPHIFAELSNLAIKMPENRFKEFMGKCIFSLRNFNEVHINKNKIIEQEEVKKLGVADTGIIISSEEGDHLILAKDRRLIGNCEKRGLKVINFDTLRWFNWSRS